MSGTASCATSRPYGVKLVCRTWEQPRSSYYAHRRAAELPVRVAAPGKRGPKTALPDDQLLELIRAGRRTEKNWQAAPSSDQFGLIDIMNPD